VATAALFIGLWSVQLSAATLITDEEALRPAAALSESAMLRGITRAPTIEFEAPSLAADHKPFDFRIKLQAHGGAAIDPTKVRVTYLKMPSVDLTDRLRPFITASGINMPEAECPAGKHPLLIDVEDNDGRVNHAQVTLTVEQKAP
jgi:hypothetical protein